MSSIVCTPYALFDYTAWVRALSGECDMLSLHEGQKFSRSAIEGEATKRAPTRGAPTGDLGRMVHVGAAGLGTHKGCPYGG